MKFNFFEFLIFLFVLVLFSGCSYLSGIASIEVREDINQSLIEDFLIKNTTLEKQNISVVSSIIMTLENLNNLQVELISIEKQIENISSNLKNLENNSNLAPEAVDNLFYLNELITKSQFFVNSLQSSSFFWYNYLNDSKNDVYDLNFSNNDDGTVRIVNSIYEPLEAFE